MKKSLLLYAAVGALFVSSCTTTNKTMREPMTRVELERGDFDLSQQVTASAQSTKILFIDFSRLFNAETGSVNKDQTSFNFSAGSMFNIPVIGDYIQDQTANYALYNLMQNNEGYDVVFYPQYKTKVQRPIGLGIYTITTVEVTARLGKFKN